MLAPAYANRRRSLVRVLFKLESEDGTLAEPPTMSSAVPNWCSGDTIQLVHRALRVIGKRDDDADQPPVLEVEDD